MGELLSFPSVSGASGQSSFWDMLSITEAGVATVPTQYAPYRFWKPALESGTLILPATETNSSPEALWRTFQRQALKNQGVQFLDQGSPDRQLEYCVLPEGWYVQEEYLTKKLMICGADTRPRAMISLLGKQRVPVMEVTPRFYPAYIWTEDEHDGRLTAVIGICDGNQMISANRLVGPPVPQDQDTLKIRAWKQGVDQLEISARMMVDRLQDLMHRELPGWWDPAKYWDAETPSGLKDAGGAR